MNLPSRLLLLKLKVLGGKLITQDTREYSLTLRDMNGTRQRMRAVGIKYITEVKRTPKVKHLRGIFPEAKSDAAEAFSRPYGRVYIMLGMESKSLHFSDGYKAGDLMLNKSAFSPGWVLTNTTTSPQAPSPTILNVLSLCENLLHYDADIKQANLG